MEIDKDTYDLGDILKQLREQKGISQAEAGNRIGVSRSTINNYEANTQDPRLPTLRKLAKLYSVTTDYLLGMTWQSYIEHEGLDESQKGMILKVSEMMAEEFKKINKNSHSK